MVEIQGTAFGKCFTHGANGVPIIATAYARDKYWAWTQTAVDDQNW